MAAVGVTLVTGATGLVGSHVARGLVERGDDVRLAVPERAGDDDVVGLPAERVACDVLDRRSVRRAMRDVERVFHCAGTTDLRLPADAVFALNVIGTRTVLEEALRAGVGRVVHTSSVAAVGPAERGSTADESQLFTAGRYGLAAINARHEAEAEALRLCAQGLPVVIVCPALVLGRGGGRGGVASLVQRFLARQIPLYADGAVNVVGARDVARGHLLADELGRVGERYVLGNRNFTLDRLFADLGRLSGVEPPAVRLPVELALAAVRALEVAPLPGGPPVTEAEVRASSLWWAFRSTKAKRELGWTPGHHEEPLVEAIEWVREREAGAVSPPGARQPLALRVAGAGLRTSRTVLRRLSPG
jgi:dihydroflavonol-4-reductase